MSRTSSELCRIPRVLLLLVLFGTALRLQGVDGFLINPDEAMFLQTANREHLSDVFGTSLFHAHPPASYYVYHFAGWIVNDIFWMRMLSVIAGVAVIPLAWGIGGLLFGTFGAIALAFLVTFSPGLIELSSVSRNYSFAFASMMLCILSFVGFLKLGGRKRFAGFVLGGALSFSFLYSCIIPLAALNLVLLVHGIARRKGSRWWAGIVAGQLPSAALFLFYVYIHILPFSRLRAGSYNQSWMEYQFSTGLRALIGNTVDLFAALLTEPLSIPYLVLAIAGLVILVGQKRWLLLTGVLVPFVLSLLFVAIGKLPYGGTRHTFYLFPFCFAAIVPALVLGYEKSSDTKWLRWCIPLLLAAHAGIASVDAALLRNRQELPVREGEFRRAMEVLAQNAGPDDMVLIDEQSALVMSRHVPELSSWYWETEPRAYTVGNLHIYYIPHTRWYFKPPQFLVAFDEARRAFDLPVPPRVWAVLAGWEEQEKLAKQIEKEVDGIELPDTGFVPGKWPGSHQLLFAIEGPDLEKVRNAFPEWEHSD